ncbi:MAG TPA: tRNA 2-selenouridine(34) synthase MnmH [Burkholderiales bacterium]|nr:tRNA 2-selenouridine(34) synthase MnmH [Burkholderiales bacterium]
MTTNTTITTTTTGPAANREERSQTPNRGGRPPIPVNVAQLSEFDEVIDVRSEGEYADDHIPGAINCPVLDNDERARVGTIYKQSSSFDAKKIGAALVSANIARHLRERFENRAKAWRPLVYCWRGGGRSGSLAHVLVQIGWRVGQLDGGYKAYRRAVIAELAELPKRYRWRVVCGMTGTGKSRLLRALEQAGAQVLDLEALAAHRGSVLGNVPDEQQPTQKMFDSVIWDALQRFDPTRPVYVEAESRKIGRLRVTEALIDAMWGSECIALQAPLPVRIELLMSEYAHFVSDGQLLASQLECLAALHGRATIGQWQALAHRGDFDALVEALLVRHYDPAYTRSTLKHYPALDSARRFVVHDGSDGEFELMAAALEHSAAAGA